MKQQRYSDHRLYFNELATTSRQFYPQYVGRFMTIAPGTRVLEVGCGEGGNLLPFAELGCVVVGVDTNAEKIDNARRFFADDGRDGLFVAQDFLEFPLPASDAERYDLVLAHDVIEHIEWPFKQSFVEHLYRFVKPGGLVFFRFPAWQMPFGGHQQICSSSLRKVPYFHLLPMKTYVHLLERKGERESTVSELASIKRSAVPVERFERLVRRVGLKRLDRTLWLINPHYREKFGLRPIREIWPFTVLLWLRNFYTTSAWYMLRK